MVISPATAESVQVHQHVPRHPLRHCTLRQPRLRLLQHPHQLAPQLARGAVIVLVSLALKIRILVKLFDKLFTDD